MKSHFLIIALICVSYSTYAQSIWDNTHLEKVKSDLNQSCYSSAYQALISEANYLLKVSPLSVMMKEKTPTSGDKHDYMSQARYFWPDTTKANGLPYINRDGQSNPELEKLDRNRLGNTANRITTLSLAWYFSGKEIYAQKATELIRVWFLNKQTAMNPNFKYAQMIPGVNGDKGRCYGVLDGYSFVEMLDAVSLLEGSKAFTYQDKKQLKKWFSCLLNWMLYSEQGKEESLQKNNHSTAYDAQIIAFALYTNNQEIAMRTIRNFPKRRIFKQVEPDGKQPYELTRTLAFGYSQYNIAHFIDVCQMARKLNIRIDEETSDDGRNLYKAVDFLLPYVGKQLTEWPYQQINEWEDKQQEFCKSLYRLYILNPKKINYKETSLRHMKLDLNDRFNLLYIQCHRN